MITSKAGIDFVKRHEGFRATPYRDVAGVMTIGYGHAIQKGEVFGALSSLEATAVLGRDLAIAEAAVNKLVTVGLQQTQFDTLVDFIFNLGVNAFTSSTLLKKINATAPIADIQHEMLRWIYAGGVVAQGLVNRRSDEWNLYLNGNYGV